MRNVAGRAWLRSGVLAAAFAAGVYASCAQAPLVRGFTFDNQIYYYMAVRVADGVPPHVSVVDHKHHLPAMLSGWAIRAGRLLGVDDVYAARAMSIFAAGVLTACTAQIALDLAGPVAGAIAALALLVSPGLYTQAAMGVRPQLFMAAFMTAALVAYARRRRFVAGVSATAAFLCWQPAALVGAGLAAAALLERDRVRAIGGLVAGAVTAVAAYEAYYVWHGAVGEQIRQSYLMSSNFESYPYPALADSLRFFVNYGIGWRVDRSAWLAAAFLISLCAVGLWLLIRPRSTLACWREQPAWPAAVACALLATALTFLTHEGYPDMFFVEPFIAVSAGACVALAVGLAARARWSAPIGWAVAAAAAIWMISLHHQRRDVFSSSGYGLAHQRELAAQVDLLFDDHGTVWAVGAPHVLALAGRENFLPLALLIDKKVQAYAVRNAGPQGYLPVRDGRLPGAILSSRGGLRALVPWLPREYRRTENRSFSAQGIQVWVRRSPRPGDRRSPGAPREILG